MRNNNDCYSWNVNPWVEAGWYFQTCDRPVLMVLRRLKLLKDEITKDYFISLKRFLWEEGVRGPNDTPKSCKVYPPGV